MTVAHLDHASPRLEGRVFRLVDVCFATFIIFLGSKILLQLGYHSLLWAVAYAWFFLLAALHFSEMIDTIRRNLVYVLFGVVSAASTLWSFAPVSTLRFGIQLSVSILMAVYIGTRLSVRQIFVLFLAVACFGVLLSWINRSGVIVDPLNENDLFHGVYLSKNAFGEGVTNFALSATIAFFLTRSYLLRAALLIIAVLAVSLLMQAESASGIVFAMFGFAAVIVVYAMSSSALTRSLMVLIITLGVVAVPVVAILANVNPWHALLEVLNKDTTLTGRTVLWMQAVQVFEVRPLLGVGAAGYWNAPEFSNTIAAFQSVYGEGVLSFHNLILEMLVSFGILGPMLHLMMGATTVQRGIHMAIRHREILGLWTCVLVFTFYLQALVGTTLYKPHDATLILLVALGVALERALRGNRIGL